MSIRDTVREANAVLAKQAAQLGLNIDDIRRESRSDQAVASMIVRLSNSPTPTQGHERIYQDDFAGQTFNGTNSDFTITRDVLGQNILLNRVEQATGTLMPLRRTSNPAPGGDEFWFDGFFTVRVGTPPQSLDALLATYVTVL
jgi:hypothetical protein